MYEGEIKFDVRICYQIEYSATPEAIQNLMVSTNDGAKVQGVISRVRPVVMTALMAMIGLMSAAISTGIGSEI